MRWIYALFLLSFAFAAPQTYLPPSQDPFYELPPGFEDAKLGTILKSRPIPYQLRGLFFPIQVDSTWQFLVRSTDALGNATAVVTTIIKPFNADPIKLITYLSAEDSAAVDCAVSWSMQVPSGQLPTLVVQADMAVVLGMLDEGWYVLLTDYEGLNAAFTCGIQAGQGNLDGLRAALQTQNITGLDPDAKTIFYGYSGGALASGWAASLQPTYAPELKPHLLGMAVGGFHTNITASLQSLEGGLFAGLAPAGMKGLLNAYPKLVPIAEEQFMSQEKHDEFYSVSTMCLTEAIINFLFQEFLTGPNRYFKSGWNFTQIPEVAQVLNENTLAFEKGGPMPEIPLFVFHGKHDEVAPYAQALRVYNNWCEWGIESFEFNVDELSEHITQFAAGAPAALSWIQGRFNGTAAVQGCQTTTRLSNLEYPGSIHTLAYQLDSIFGSWMQEPLGPANASVKRLQRFYTPLHELKKRGVLLASNS